MTSQTKSYLFAGISILFWSTVATAFKIALADQKVYQVLLVAGLSSFVVLGLALFINKKVHLLKLTTRKDLLFSMMMGFMNPFFYYLVLFKAYENLPAQVAQPLNLLWPIVIVLVSIPLLKQKLEFKSFFALLISFSGIVVVSSQGGGENFEKEQIPFMVLALSTSLIWSLYWILNVRDKRDETVKLFFGFLFGTMYLLLGSIFIDDAFPSGMKQWSVDIYIGIFEMGLTYLFWLKALQYTESTEKISNLIFIFPFISLIFIHIILGESIYMTTLYGLILVVIGIFVQKARFGKRKDVKN